MYKICDVVLPQRGGSKPPPYAVYAAVSDSPTHYFHQYFNKIISNPLYKVKGFCYNIIRNENHNRSVHYADRTELRAPADS